MNPGNPDDDMGADKGVDEATSADADEPTTAKPEPELAPPVREEPVMPTADEAALRRRDLPRPNVVRTAFYLASGAAALGVVTGIYLITQKQVMLDYAVSPDNPLRTTAARAENIVTTYLWLYMIQAVALGGFLTLFAYKAQEGVRRARMMMLIVVLIMLLFHFYVGWAWPDLISGFCALVAIALMYLPSTREFFGPRQTIT